MVTLRATTRNQRLKVQLAGLPLLEVEPPEVSRSPREDRWVELQEPQFKRTPPLLPHTPVVLGLLVPRVDTLRVEPHTPLLPLVKVVLFKVDLAMVELKSPQLHLHLEPEVSLDMELELELEPEPEIIRSPLPPPL